MKNLLKTEELAEALFALFDGLGYGGKDFSALLQMLRGRLETLDA